MRVEKIKGLWGWRKYIFDSFKDFEENYDSKKCKRKNLYQVNAKIISIENNKTSKFEDYFLELISRDKKINGIVRRILIAEKIDWTGLGVSGLTMVPIIKPYKCRDNFPDIVHAKVGDNVIIGGGYEELYKALNDGEEIHIKSFKFLDSVK